MRNSDSTQLQFTRSWFRRRNQATFCEHVQPRWAGQPITYLELGVFEGMSLVWMLQHVLTHPDSRAVGVDPWLLSRKIDADAMEAVRLRAESNTEPWRDRCQLIRANSVEALARMNGRRGFAGIHRGTLDLCLIDGDHMAPAVYSDAKHVLSLLRPGGWMLFDDVSTTHRQKQLVHRGLSLFLEETGNRIQLAWQRGRVVAYEKC